MLGIGPNVWNPSTTEAEAGEWKVPSQPMLCCRTLSRKKQKMEEEKRRRENSNGSKYRGWRDSPVFKSPCSQAHRLAVRFQPVARFGLTQTSNSSIERVWHKMSAWACCLAASLCKNTSSSFSEGPCIEEKEVVRRQTMVHTFDPGTQEAGADGSL